MAVDKRDGAQQSVEVQERISDHIRVFHRELPVWTPHFKEMQTGYEYLAGNHYEEPQKEWYKSLRRPTRVFNLIFPLFNQVLGDFLLNDQKMKVYAKPGGTNEIAALFEDQLDHINTQSDYKICWSMVCYQVSSRFDISFPGFPTKPRFKAVYRLVLLMSLKLCSTQGVLIISWMMLNI